MAGALGLRGLEGKGPRELGDSKSGDPVGQQAPLPPGSTRGCPDTVQRLRQQWAEVIQSSLDAREEAGSPPASQESKDQPQGVWSSRARGQDRAGVGMGVSAHSLFFHIKGLG